MASSTVEASYSCRIGLAATNASLAIANPISLCKRPLPSNTLLRFPQDSAVNALIFDEFVDWILLPALRPGDILVMDNLSSHKNASTLAKIESKGVEVRFLPPYSPDLNPIEKIFSKVKASLRSFAARTKRTLDNAISKAIASITPDDCMNCFKACGYGLRNS